MNTAHLEEALQYHFHNPALLRLALTHPSCGAENNQRLEFLGDAVLQLAMSDIVFAAHPEQEEGGMTFLRARMVREETLCAVARHLQLGRYLRMDHGCEITGGRERPAVLADAMEAVLAAVYLDAGFDTAAFFLPRTLDAEGASSSQGGTSACAGFDTALPAAAKGS